MQNLLVYNQILNEACEYFNVTREDVLFNKTNAKGKQNTARTITSYLIREFTGDKFIMIGDFFQTGAEHTGAQHTRVLKKLLSKKPEDREYKNRVIELTEKIEEKINFCELDKSTTFVGMKVVSTKVTDETVMNAKKISKITGEKQYMAINNAVREKLQLLKEVKKPKNGTN